MTAGKRVLVTHEGNVWSFTVHGLIRFTTALVPGADPSKHGGRLVGTFAGDTSRSITNRTARHELATRKRLDWKRDPVTGEWRKPTVLVTDDGREWRAWMVASRAGRRWQGTVEIVATGVHRWAKMRVVHDELDATKEQLVGLVEDDVWIVDDDKITLARNVD